MPNKRPSETVVLSPPEVAALVSPPEVAIQSPPEVAASRIPRQSHSTFPRSAQPSTHPPIFPASHARQSIPNQAPYYTSFTPHPSTAYHYQPLFTARPSDVSLPAPNHISSNGYAPNHISNGYPDQYTSYNWPYSYPHANHVVPPPLANDAGWESTPPTNHVVSNAPTSHLGRSSATINNLPTQPFGLQPQYPRSTQSHAQSFHNFHSVPYPYPNNSPSNYYEYRPDPYISSSYGHYPPQPILPTPSYPWVTPPPPAARTTQPATFVQTTSSTLRPPAAPVTQPAKPVETTPKPIPQPPSITVHQAWVLLEEIDRLSAENEELRKRLQRATATPTALANPPSSMTPPTSTLLPPPQMFNFESSSLPPYKNPPLASAVPSTATSTQAALANPPSSTKPPTLPPPAAFPHPIPPFISSRMCGYAPPYDDSDSDSGSSYPSKRSPTTDNRDDETVGCISTQPSFDFYRTHDPDNNYGYNDYDDDGDGETGTTDDEHHEDNSRTTSPGPWDHEGYETAGERDCTEYSSYDDSDGHQSEGADHSDDNPGNNCDGNADYESDNHSFEESDPYS
ncbi:hypothetical protein DFP72DRAFT_1060119 [Ephemerocybe angulata]|uniref:Uncharacterized protein n=1 Tax=Ephemerocybe angulata TaxID=980116 RepID=A0A8H6ID77_9AGAR|nr:hypothetical protein DFP72DRAFT_1060119 [Tulosesus angulatus]